MKTSNWCSSGECIGCSSSGQMRSTTGNKFKCHCSCHRPHKNRKQVRRDKRRDKFLSGEVIH